MEKIRRRIFNNYDSYMYLTHGLSFGKIKYKGSIYNCDLVKHQEKLLLELITNNVIALTERNYKIIDDRIINYLKEKHSYRVEDNLNLQSRAVILNIRKFLMEL